MKISELIKQLERVKYEIGDMEVCAWPYDGQSKLYSAVVYDEDDEPDLGLDCLFINADLRKDRQGSIWGMTPHETTTD